MDILRSFISGALFHFPKISGQMSHSYTYDPLYKGTDNKTASYSLAMGYDNMHRITSKKQHLSQTGVQFDGTLNAGYELAYTYGKDAGRKFQLDNVRDINYRTEETPTDSTNINNGHKYTYDLNGNLVLGHMDAFVIKMKESRIIFSMEEVKALEEESHYLYDK